jgi:hypothetical protein
MIHSQKKRLIDKDIRDLLYYITPNGTIWEGPLSARREEEHMACIQKEIQRDDVDREKEKEEIEAAIQAEKEKKVKEQEIAEKKIQEEKEEVAVLTEVQQTDIDKQDIDVKHSDSPVDNLARDDNDASTPLETKPIESESPMQSAVNVPETLIEGLRTPLDLRGISAKKRLPVRDKPVISSISNVFNFCDDDDDDGEFRTRSKR